MTAADAERFPHIDTTAPRYAVGLMAGTSLDGIDAALARIEGAGDAIRIETLATHYQPYTPDERTGLLRLVESGTLADLCAWDAYLGERFARAAQAVIQKASPPRVDCIGSHGQTAWHAPDAHLLGMPTPTRCRLGSPMLSRRGWARLWSPTSARAIWHTAGRARRSCLSWTGCCCAATRNPAPR
jgi:1,6-anhydro-N-acetylmuramate kinase